MKEVTSSVEALEIEAERILEEARARASEILLKSKEEVGRILSSELSLEEVKMECDKIIDRARIEAEGKIEDSKEKASEISNNTHEKMEGIIDRLVNIVVGQG
jgi:cell division septum initiation protein DivIVA